MTYCIPPVLTTEFYDAMLLPTKDIPFPTWMYWCGHYQPIEEGDACLPDAKGEALNATHPPKGGYPVGQMAVLAAA
jgi:hypothetical protein